MLECPGMAKLRNISPTNMVTAVALPSKAHLTRLVRTVAASYWIMSADIRAFIAANKAQLKAKDQRRIGG